jgi:hypothetical protein
MKMLVQSALAAALIHPDEGGTPGAVHQNRSKHFVEGLAAELRNRHLECGDISVFSKYYKGNRKLHGLNELMYDVAVCETRQVASSTGRADLAYVSSLVVAIESEMAKNSREALYDFSKLVMGNARTNLFVGPQAADEVAYLNALGPAADCCTGETFVALVPHPAEWRSEGAVDVRLRLRGLKRWIPA